MSDHLKRTIADAQLKLAELESSVKQTKSLINQLSEMAGTGVIYKDLELETRARSSVSIRSDQFYGQPQATCVREFLEMRKALDQGPATVNEIFAALQEGGFAFETKNDENAKRGLRISITKNTALFHKLPNGKIGLLTWYPNAKQTKKVQSDSAGKNDSAGEASEAEEGGEQ